MAGGKILMRRIICTIIAILLLFNVVGCSNSDTQVSSNSSSQLTEEVYLDPSLSIEKRVEDLLSRMTLEEKAAQMVQGVNFLVKPDDLKNYPLGSILSIGADISSPRKWTLEDWDQQMKAYQDAILSRDLKIPMLYGIDAVHGHSNVKDAVIFPQNIGLGAANDQELVKEMGRVVGDEMKLTKIIWNFYPCVAIANDPRWGRTYESYSSDPDIVLSLGKAYLEGQQEAGIVTTAKHYLADGGVQYGTGNSGYLIDRGDAQMSEDELRNIHLKPYTELVKSGVDVVMVSYSRFNGASMHQNKYLLTDVLKTELGFKGFIISDFEGIRLMNEANDYNAQVQLAINAGVDMLMEPLEWSKATSAIIDNVNNGNISQERIDDAVSRILTVKFTAGLFDDPYLKSTDVIATELGSHEYRNVASELVSKSLVLLKNEDNILPLKKSQKIFVTGPAANDIGMQCGGWTLERDGLLDALNSGKITDGTTILEGLEAYSEKYDVEFITDENRISEADAIILALGEIPYAEGEGDTSDLSIIGEKASPDNQEAINFANQYDLPIITLVVAGRHVLIDEFVNDWNSIVMCYLPGTEGQGIAKVLFGEEDFTGKLPMPWYKSVEDIGKENPELLFDFRYGLTY